MKNHKINFKAGIISNKDFNQVFFLPYIRMYSNVSRNSHVIEIGCLKWAIGFLAVKQ